MPLSAVMPTCSAIVQDPDLALWVVAGASIWFFVGFYMIILLGGLQEIPAEVLEAARLDGVG
ncbi:ABC transporter permease subunit [Amycolatopsis sp. ATCC 39116]|uniref:ABC transporter permease subunit n=1 Tax=Amycolatopsis sp. (strain ATCC 39116 / 75iv2) TaxID=385957 RepID=UPI00037CDDD7|nr:ABC transporter permease subunit [Amycolatopsis sp. ATCC 39116]